MKRRAPNDPSVPVLWRCSLRDHTTLSPSARFVGHTISTYMDTQGYAYLLKSTIARGMGWSQKNHRAVDRGVRELKNAGLLDITVHPGRNRCNDYQAKGVATDGYLPVKPVSTDSKTRLYRRPEVVSTEIEIARTAENFVRGEGRHYPPHAVIDEIEKLERKHRATLTAAEREHVMSLHNALSAAGDGGAVNAPRQGRTVDEWAHRWNLDAETTLEWLSGFEARGYARRHGACWFATAKAHRIDWFGPDEAAA